MKFIILFLALTLSISSYAAKKVKKKSAIKTPTNLTEQANVEINEPVKIQDKSMTTVQDNSGVISVQSQSSNDMSLTNSYDFGLSISNLQTIGLMTNKKNTTFDLASASQPYVAQLDLYKTIGNLAYIQKVGLHFGFHQFYTQTSVNESLLVSQSYLQVSTASVLLKQQKNEIDFITHFGFLNFQAANSGNAFLNINDKTYFLGGGFEYSYQVNQNLKLYTNAVYRSKILSQTDLQLKTVAGTLGASYLW